MIIKRLIKMLPRPIRGIIYDVVILSIHQGQYRSRRKWESVDRYGNPIPWYTYPAIEFIKKIDFSERTVFEYGSGNSTIFWASRCKRLTSVEDNREWFEKISKKLPHHVTYEYLQGDDYIQAIQRGPDKYSVILIDGSYRYECAILASARLKEDGFIILDNSDREKETAEYLENSGLIAVDMHGFGPINGYIWTTSFYFTRQVDLKRNP